MLRTRHAANTALGISDNLILLAGCVVFLFVLLLPEPGAPSIYFTVLQGAAATLKGYVSASDINSTALQQLPQRRLVSRRPRRRVFAGNPNGSGGRRPVV